MPPKKQYQDVSIGLNEADRKRLFEIAYLEQRSKTEVARDAIRWYLEHYEHIKEQGQEAEHAAAIRYATEQLLRGLNQGVERICKMLNRQGLSIETLFELTYASLPDNPAAIEAFTAAANKAKEKVHKRVQRDEAEIAGRIKKVVTS